MDRAPKGYETIRRRELYIREINFFPPDDDVVNAMLRIEEDLVRQKDILKAIIRNSSLKKLLHLEVDSEVPGDPCWFCVPVPLLRKLASLGFHLEFFIDPTIQASAKSSIKATTRSLRRKRRKRA